MKNFENIDEVLDFAIKNEQDAYDFYIKLSVNSKIDYIKNTFLDFANEELKHKEILESVKVNGVSEINVSKVIDLKISDYLVSAKISEDISYEDALVLAMKREKAAYKLYLALSEKTDSLKMKKLFLNLANQEANHKLRFETEYDDIVYRDN